MWTRLRQLALITRDLGPVVVDLKAIFGLEVCHVDPNVGVFGLENRLLPVGTQFIEVLQPIQENTAGGRYLERRGGDTGYMVICQSEEPLRGRMDALGIRRLGRSLQAAEPGARVVPMQLHPQDTRGSFLEIDWHIDGDAPIPPWEHGVGTGWEWAIRTEVVRRIAAAEIQTDQPATLAARWSRILDISEERAGDDTFVIRLENADLRFVPATDGRGEGLGGMDLEAADGARALAAAKDRGCLDADGAIRVGGLRIRLV
jgi:hypothetical protein